MRLINKLRKILLRDFGRYLYASYYSSGQMSDLTLEMTEDLHAELMHDLAIIAHDEKKLIEHVLEDILVQYVETYDKGE